VYVHLDLKRQLRIVKILMNVRPTLAHVINLLIVKTFMDHTTVHVKQDTEEMELIVKIRTAHQPSMQHATTISKYVNEIPNLTNGNAHAKKDGLEVPVSVKISTSVRMQITTHVMPMQSVSTDQVTMIVDVRQDMVETDSTVQTRVQETHVHLSVKHVPVLMVHGLVCAHLDLRILLPTKLVKM
jgi:hypothetical protein